MGNNRFTIWDMIPNPWVYKLKRPSKSLSPSSSSTTTKLKHQPASPSPASPLTCSSSSSNSSSSSSSSNNTGHQSHFSHRRKSYYFTRDLTNTSIPPAASAAAPEPDYSYEKKPISSSRPPDPRKNRQSVRPHRSNSVSTGCSCRASATIVSSVRTKPAAADSTTPDHAHPDLGSCSKEESIIPESCSTPETYSYYSSGCSGNGVKKISNKMSDKHPPDDSASCGLHLRPITTTNIPARLTEEDRKLGRSKSGAAADASFGRVTNGLKLRTKSPRMGNRPITDHHHHHHRHHQGRKSLSRRRNGRRGSSSKSLAESFAVVKSSEDPGRDFRESMVEMIVENDLRASKDLEDLLACYLSLNSDHYHDLIITVFKQIWFDQAVIH